MRSHLTHLLACGFLCLAVMGPAGAALATDDASALQTRVTASKEEIMRSYILQDFPSPHPPFSFNILMPKDWLWFEKEGRPTEPNGKPQLLIAYGDRGDTSLVEILALKTERPVVPADWLHEWLKVNNYQILANRIIPAATGRNADVKARKIVKGRPVLFRIRTFKKDDYIYILHCFSDEETYPQVEQHFLVAAETFELTGNTKGAP